jgi:integrase
VLTRPGIVRAAPTLPGVTRIRPPQLRLPAATGPAVKVSHLHSNLSASRRTHDLRHTYATLLLSRGVSPRMVMDILEHSQIAVTMNTYGHVIPAMQHEAAGHMDAALGDELDADEDETDES